ncbi:MAG: TonB family protein [Candidatus Latescibacterota bacterium]|nr:MAG: TonB family protein [Candidatus Latescibacterota bacterium]
MKNALIVSLCFHIAVGLVAMWVVRIHQVRFIPRDVYAVTLVTLEEATKPKKKPLQPPKEEKREEIPPKIEEEKPEELVEPTRQKKPEKKPEEKKKIIPSTTIEKKKLAESAEVDTTAVPEVATGDIALDVEDFPFAYYLATIKRKIAANWKVPGTSSGGSIYCRVYFRIDKSGAIETPVTETSSGNFLFDQAALRAVFQANPLPPLPGGFDDDYLGVHFSFAYEEE